MSEETPKDAGNTEETPGQANLKAPWKPGQSGNPQGRPVGAKTGLRARLIQMLDQDTEDDILKILEAKGVKLGDKDKAAVISTVVGREAMKGNMQAVKIIAEQTELPHPKDLKMSGDFIILMSEADQKTL
jgi:hypothetical protein